MNDKRLTAYQVMRRVARVREIGASMALAEAATAEKQQRTRRDGIADARGAVAAAARGQRASHVDLDMGRYELLAQLGEVLGERLEEAKNALSAAEDILRQRADASLVAARHRENVDEHFHAARQAKERLRSESAREEAIELWIKGRAR